MNTNVVLLALMGVLVLMAGIQAFQLTSLSEAVTNGAVVSTGTQSGVLSQLSQASQVGGCG